MVGDTVMTGAGAGAGATGAGAGMKQFTMQDVRVEPLVNPVVGAAPPQTVPDGIPPASVHSRLLRTVIVVPFPPNCISVS